MLSYSLLLVDSKKEQEMSINSSISNLVDVSVFKNKTNNHPLWLLFTGRLGGREMEFLYKLSPKLSRSVPNFYDYLPLFRVYIPSSYVQILCL